MCYLAATYLYHIAKAHAFQSGNKRTAYVAALTFLDMNGVVITRPAKALEDAAVAAVKDEIGKQEVAELLRALASCDD